MIPGPVRSRSRASAALLALALTAPIAGCAATTYDSSVTTVDKADIPTTTTPTGAASELLPRLVSESAGLSTRIVDDADQEGALERIEALWGAARAEVEAAHPELVDAFDRSVALCRSAVERNRPADADKASKNLTTLVGDALAP